MMWKVCLHILGLCSTIECCMKCDQETMGVYGALKNEYIDRNVRAENDQDIDRALSVRKKMRKILDHGLQVSFSQVNVYPYIDDATLNQLGSTFRSLMNKTMATDLTDLLYLSFLNAMNIIVRSLFVHLENMELSVSSTQRTIFTSFITSMEAVELHLAAMQDSVQALQKQGKNRAGAATGTPSPSPQWLTPISATEAGTHTLLSGHMLPDFLLPPPSSKQKQTLKLARHLKPNIKARELFKHFVGFVRYQQWTHNTNFNGSGDKTVLPVNLHDAIMQIVEEQFLGDCF